MHMIHFEDAYVTSKGRIKFGQAYASPLGVAILSVFFEVDHTKPQVFLDYLGTHLLIQCKYFHLQIFN